MVLGGFAVRVGMRPLVVALTGAPCPVRVDGRRLAMDGPLQLAAGAMLELGTPSSGLRTYLAVRGGMDVSPVLGSRSTDTLAGLGPEPLSEGDGLRGRRRAGRGRRCRRGPAGGAPGRAGAARPGRAARRLVRRR